MVTSSQADQLANAIRNLDQRIRDITGNQRVRGCYVVTDPDVDITIPTYSTIGYDKLAAGTTKLAGTTPNFAPHTLFTLPRGSRPQSCQLHPLAYGGVAKVCNDGVVQIIDPPTQVVLTEHQEFAAASGRTLVLTKTPRVVLCVTRNGVVQSTADGDYSVAGATLSFNPDFDPVHPDRITVDYSPVITDQPMQPHYEEFLPANGTDSVALSKPAMHILNVSRNGLVASADNNEYSWFEDVVVFTTPFAGNEHVVVGYTALPSTWGQPEHYEATPAAGNNTVTLLRTPLVLLGVARNGLIQSSIAGHFRQRGNVLTFTTRFAANERIVVWYVSTEIPGLSLDSISFRAAA